MERWSDERFIKAECNMDNVIAIRIKNGEFYFIGWMENAEKYKIQVIPCVDKALLERDLIMLEEIYTAITTVPDYNRIDIVYEVDETGNPIKEEDKKYVNVFDRFLSFVKNYERNGVSDNGDHDIFVTNCKELSMVCDALRDGDYVFIVEDLSQNH